MRVPPHCSPPLSPSSASTNRRTTTNLHPPVQPQPISTSASRPPPPAFCPPSSSDHNPLLAGPSGAAATTLSPRTATNSSPPHHLQPLPITASPSLPSGTASFDAAASLCLPPPSGAPSRVASSPLLTYGPNPHPPVPSSAVAKENPHTAIAQQQQQQQQQQQRKTVVMSTALPPTPGGDGLVLPGATGVGSGADAAEAPPLFVTEAYYPVFVSRWEKDTGVCSICRNLVEGPCISCQTAAPCSQRCYMRWGECGHAFHDHCIHRWLKSRQVCPLDNMEWKNKAGWSDEYHILQLVPDANEEEEELSTRRASFPAFMPHEAPENPNPEDPRLTASA